MKYADVDEMAVKGLFKFDVSIKILLNKEGRVDRIQFCDLKFLK